MNKPVAKEEFFGAVVPGTKVLKVGANRVTIILAVSKGAVYFDRPHKLSRMPEKMSIDDFFDAVVNGSVKIVGYNFDNLLNLFE